MKYFNFILFTFCISVLFLTCGNYNTHDRVELTTYIKGKVTLLPETFSLNFSPGYYNFSPAPVLISGVKCYIDYAGKRYSAHTNIQGEFVLELPAELNKKDNYLITAEIGNIILYAFIETNKYGDAENVVINEKSTIIYYIINRYLEKYGSYGINKRNIIPETFYNYTTNIDLILEYVKKEKIPIVEWLHNKHFLSLLEETKSNYSGLIAAIPHDTQNNFYFKDSIKLFFSEKMDTNVLLSKSITYNKPKLSDYSIIDVWNDDGTILTLTPAANGYFLPNTEFIMNVTQNFKTFSGKPLTPVELKFSASTKKHAILSDYFIHDDYFKYTYLHKTLTFPIQSDTQIHTVISADTIINNRRVFNIGQNLNNFSAYSNDEDGLLIHLTVSKGISRIFNPPVKLSDRIAYAGDKFVTNNNHGTFISEIISTDNNLRIEFKYKYFDKESYETKNIEFEKNTGIKKITKIGVSELSLINYRKKIKLIKPLNNTIVPLMNNQLYIEWTKSSDTGLYRIDLSKTANFSNIVDSASTTDNKILFDDIRDTGQFYLRIVLNNANAPDTYTFYISDYTDLSDNKIDNTVSGFEYVRILKDILSLQNKNLYYYIKDSPENITISSFEGKINWMPDTDASGLYNISIGLCDTGTNKIYHYNYQLYLIPKILINTFINDEGETITFYPDNTFIKTTYYDTELMGDFIILKDTIVLNYSTYFDTSIQYTETGTNFFIGYDTVSYYINNRKIVYKLVTPAVIPDDPIQPANPQIISIPKTMAKVNEPYAYWVKVQPAVWGKITYELIHPPTGMTVNNQGVIYWIPGSAYENQSVLITVRVHEAGAGYTTQVYYITVSSQ